VLLGEALSLAAALRAYERCRGTIAPAFPGVRPPAAAGRAARAINLLLLGVDDLVAGEAEAAEVGMIALVHVQADRKGVHVVSIPHATVISVVGHGDRPIGTTLALGGVPVMVQCVEQLFEVRVNHVAVVPLSGIAVLTDALGGVAVDNGSAFTSEGVDFPSGALRLDGDRAVAFVRRGAAAGARIDAEHAYLRGVIAVLLRAGGGRRPPLEKRLLQAITSQLVPHLQVDPGFDGAAVARLAVSLHGLRGGDVHLARLPVRSEASADGRVLLVCRDGLAALRQHLRADTLDEEVPGGADGCA
jgi:polyisoprenyl-teichoic acid--peptidoglycan teichoic acid transferase